MKNVSPKAVDRALLVGGFILLAPAIALANPGATSAVTVHQEQQVISSTPADLTQSATIATSTTWGSTLHAESKASGSQELWDVNKAQQSQTLRAGSRLWWASNTGPTTARAATAGSVDQVQDAWGTPTMTAHQSAGLWQKSWVGEQRSQLDVNTKQHTTNVVGDLTQKQHLAGHTNAHGRIFPPAPTCDWCGHGAHGGGSFVSRVTVIVDNFFNF